jgi:predicted amidohydrolase
MTSIKKQNRLPREVWVAGISLKGLWPVDTIEKRMKDLLARMQSVYPFEPDVIVLPETIHTSWVREKKALEEIAEDETGSGPITSMIADVAKKQKCYITCPVITKKEGRYYNSSILIDRSGNRTGVFHKVRPTITEIVPGDYFKGGGITPGKMTPPVFKTDFGTVGLQICMDAAWWFGSWKSLKESGAEIVLFSSQAGYGNYLRHHAWLNQYYIVSSTGEDARILDMTGDVIESDGLFARWTCAAINLEKVMLHIWPQVNKFDAIQKKYGRKVRFRIYHEENWATLESRDPGIKVMDILREYELPTYEQQIQEATLLQNNHRAHA